MHLLMPPRVEDGRVDLGLLPVPLGGGCSVAETVPKVSN